MLLLIFFINFVELLCHITSQNTKFITNNQMLNNKQWIQIRSLLNNKNLPCSMKNKINYILYKKYETMAFLKAYHFKKNNYYKCKYISLSELSLYSKMALYKAIKNYNPNYHFYNFLKIYIQSELYKGITDLYPICPITKTERMKKKTISITDYQKLNVSEKKIIIMKRIHYKKSLDTKFIGKDEWLIDKNIPYDDYLDSSNKITQVIFERDKYEKIWYKINNSYFLTPFQKRIFKLKYDFYLNKIRSNREISKLMVCSEEYVRKNLLQIFREFM